MDPSRHARIKEVFLDALDRPAADRAAYLDRACAGDPELRTEVGSLLAHHSDAPLIVDTSRPSVWDPKQLVGVLLDGRYRVEAHVAEGGFGDVYRAQNERWGRPVAIKVFKTSLPPEAQAELKEAFVKEGALLNELSRRTTAIVQSYDVGTCTGPDGAPLLFTVLEWVEGRSLAALIADERRSGAPPWALDQVLETLAPIAEALGVAHASGVAHRDVKPANILVVEEHGARTLKLADFGTAKIAGERTGGFLSTGGKLSALTLDYAAPEQLSKAHGPTGPWTDVYALAFICVELLLGRHPFGADDVGTAMVRTCHSSERPTPGRLGVPIPPRVEAVYARALAVELAARPPDAATLWRELVAARDAAIEPRARARPGWLRWLLGD